MDGFAVTAGPAGRPPARRRRVARRAPDRRGRRRGHRGADLHRRRAPPGADAVARVEDTREEDGHGRARRPRSRPGENVRRAGEDLARRRRRRCAAGTRLGPAELAAAVAAGARARSRARAGRASPSSARATSCARPARRSAPGRSTTRTSPALAAHAERAGAVVVTQRHRPRRPRARREAAARRARSTRPTSSWSSRAASPSGPHDHVKPALEALGVTETFWRVGAPARQADVVRHPRATGSSSACPATPSRRSSPSRCSPAPRCSPCRAPPSRRRAPRAARPAPCAATPTATQAVRVVLATRPTARSRATHDRAPELPPRHLGGRRRRAGADPARRGRAPGRHARCAPIADRPRLVAARSRYSTMRFVSAVSATGGRSSASGRSAEQPLERSSPSSASRVRASARRPRGRRCGRAPGRASRSTRSAGRPSASSSSPAPAGCSQATSRAA